MALANRSSNCPSSLRSAAAALISNSASASARLTGHSLRGQDTRAPSGVLRIERTGKMNAAPRCGTFASDHTVAHDTKGIYRDVPVITFRHLNGADQFVRYFDKGRHCTVLSSSRFQHFDARANER